jgi:hypothetical protein
MNDVAETFTDRFLKVQLVIEEERPFEPAAAPPSPPAPPTRRYNALGVLEEVPPPASGNGAGTGTNEVVDVGPAESPGEKPAAAKRDPLIVGAGKARNMSDIQNAAANNGPVDWTNVGRNDPCPCGSGKKFKKCHGVSV